MKILPIPKLYALVYSSHMLDKILYFIMYEAFSLNLPSNTIYIAHLTHLNQCL